VSQLLFSGSQKTDILAAESTEGTEESENLTRSLQVSKLFTVPSSLFRSCSIHPGKEIAQL